MGRRFTANVPSQRITPPDVFFNRRRFLSAFGLGVLAAPFAGCAAGASQARAQSSLLEVPLSRPDVFPARRNAAFDAPPATLGRQALTPREVAASHNNFYEFLSGRGGPVWQFCGDFEVEPWQVEIGGECNNPMTLDLDDLFAFDHEERVCHFRCVERWAMNVPWSGFPLARLIEKADPAAAARYVRFETAVKEAQMPGVTGSPWYPWPYHEGLRIDEAMNELALVVTGVYGEPLLRQHGAPVRIVAPWKYGLQESQVDREDRVRAGRAVDLLAGPAARVRLPLERQPERSASPLAAERLLLARHRGAVPDPDLQRVRGVRRGPVPGRAARAAATAAAGADGALTAAGRAHVQGRR